MQAILVHEFGDADVLTPEAVTDPVAGAGEVVVDIRAAGVNPYDAYMRGGTYAVVPSLPYVPGGDAAGVVAAIGPGVAGLKPGDRVLLCAALGRHLTGCYAEKTVRPAADVVRLPDTLGFAEGAAMGVPYVTAQYALFQRGRARPGEVMFVHGASGAVGLAAVQLARRAGLRVVGSAGSASGAALVARQGAELVVDHSASGYLDAVRDFAGGPPDLVLEMLANVNLEADLALVARHGRIVIIGNRGRIEVDPRVMMMKELDVIGVAIWNADRDQVMAAMHHVLDAVGQGLRPVVERTVPLARAAEVHRDLLGRRSAGKIVLAVGGT